MECEHNIDKANLHLVLQLADTLTFINQVMQSAHIDNSAI
jgi:hypothetical protein